MTEEKSGYFKIIPIEPNIYSDASLAEIIQQLEFCGYRCEAGPLENNIAFIELKKRATPGPCNAPAEFMIQSTSDVYDLTYACSAHLADLIADGNNIVTTGDIPAGETCCFVSRMEAKPA